MANELTLNTGSSEVKSPVGPSGFGSLRPVALNSVEFRASRFLGFRSLVRRFRGLVGFRSLGGSGFEGVGLEGLRVWGFGLGFL